MELVLQEENILRMKSLTQKSLSSFQTPVL